ncbi:RND transporter [Bacillus sp. JJ1533]|uniref:RND transporter n=1 Tax=Bacillus sp. JJ1533 TaxID=3122959 RepID=UPI003000E513
MNKKDYMRAINWTIFILVILMAVITSYTTLYDLNHQPSLVEDAGSSIGFRWGSLHIIISIVILISSALLAKGWKRLFPYNVPIAIILVGFCYVFFLTFTIGWVGALGMLGFVIAFLIGVILIKSYSVANQIERRKTIGKFWVMLVRKHVLNKYIKIITHFAYLLTYIIHSKDSQTCLLISFNHPPSTILC